jgi:glutamate-1-semialdehyde 2,1-aminomutase
VNSNVRLDAPPTFFDRGSGAWLWDVDGNDYVDYLLGQGPAFLGHAPPRVLSAVEAASRKGMVFGAQHPLEVEAAERFCATVGWPDMVRFGTSGTEAVQAALRLARAVTGRTLVIRFEGHYHGWLDNVFIKVEGGSSGPASEGQVSGALDSLLVLPWNDIHALEAAFNDKPQEIAAVIMEPMMLNAGAIAPLSGYLEAVKSICEREGALLIFDEVITGFRLSRGGAAELFGVRPHLATYGKAMASGWPVAALAGEGDLMMALASGRVVHAGTFNANVMAMAATLATLEILDEPDFYPRLARIGERLIDGLAQLGRAAALPLAVRGTPAAFHLSFDPAPTEPQNYRDLDRTNVGAYHEFSRALIKHGVWVAGRGIWYVSAAHGDAEIEETFARVEATLSELSRTEFSIPTS